MSRITLALVVLAGAAIPVWAQEAGQGPAVVVSLGEAVVRMPADRAIVTLASESRAATAQEAQSKGNATMKAVQAAIEALKLAGGQFSTTGLYLMTDYAYADNKQTLRGYVGRHTITIKFDDPARAGEVVAAAVAAGANNVSGIQFDRRDRQALWQQALREAVQAARARADALAAGAGHTVDRIVRIAEEQAANVERLSNVTIQTQAASSFRSTGDAPIATGEVEVRARVLLTATIK